MLVLCTFLLADNDVEQATLEAEERGVRVYCLIAAEARLDREDPEGEFDKKVLAQHKAMLKKLAGRVMFRTSSSFHAKVVLADPFTSIANGVLLTANLTTDAMKRNEELLLQLELQEVKQLAGYLKWAIWEAAEHESIESGEFRAVKPLSHISDPKIELPVVATTSCSRQIANEALAMIERAQAEILVSCFGWDLDHPVVQALAKKAKSGIPVTVFARIRPASMPALEFLTQSGARIYGFKWLHAKALVVDGQQAMVMSANLQEHGLDKGFELGVMFDDVRLEELKHTLAYWQSAAKWELKTGGTVGDVVGLVQIWDGKAFSDANIESQMHLTLKDVEASSAETLTAAMPELPSSGKLPHLAHELKCQWNVVAPSLAKGAKPKLRKFPAEQLSQGKATQKQSEPKSVPYDPPAFTEAGGRVVVAIKSPRQLSSAMQLKAELNASAIVVE